MAAVAAAVTLLAGACGKSSSSGGSGGTPAVTTLTVLAAASLTNVFPLIGSDFTEANPNISLRFEFAGTDDLAAQIEQGSPADVFAGASTKYGDQLSGEGLIQAPAAFATNRLVLIVPAANPAGISGPQDLARPGVKLVIGAETVPVGSYTRTVLSNLDRSYGSGYSSKVLANVVSDEDAVTSVLSKVRLGEADAGFVYVTDALSSGSDVKVIELPAQAQAVATYPIAVVKDSEVAAAAARFTSFVLGRQGQAELRKAGFGPPPPEA